jgi:aromatic-L-amino-acid decarboxylase
VRLARQFATRVDAEPRFERLADVDFSVVCFRLRPKEILEESQLESLNTRLLERVNGSGEIYLSHTKLKGRYCLRLAVGNLGTMEKHLKCAFTSICEAADEFGIAG